MTERVIVIPRGGLRGIRGTWWPTVEDSGRHCAIVCCPVCSKQRTVCERIDIAGNLTVPYWCDPGECSFKERVRLGSWVP